MEGLRCPEHIANWQTNWFRIYAKNNFKLPIDITTHIRYNLIEPSERGAYEMKQADAVKAMIKEAHRTQEYVGSQMNPPMRQTSVARFVNNGNMTVNRLWEVCEILGYEIVLRPKRKGSANATNTFVLDGETKAERAEKL